MRLNTRASSVAALVALLVFAGAERCSADFTLGDAANYGLLYEGNGGKTLNYNNSNLVGNLGIGGTGTIGLSGPGTITGNVDFNGTSNVGNHSAPAGVVGGVTISGAITGGVPAVSSALSTVNSLSQTLGLEAGTSTTIASGGAVAASASDVGGVGGAPAGTLVGTSDGSGNSVFNVSGISFANGTFTVYGTSSQFVVLNIAGNVGNNGLNGSVVLMGGITSDQVLFNYTPSTSILSTYNSDYTNLTGGPTMTISTNGLTTTGVFLNPTGDYQVNHSVVEGRVIGGDTKNSAFVSGANLDAPPVPEPSELVALSAMSLLGVGGAFFLRRRAKSA
jgi:hypothetical protein